MPRHPYRNPEAQERKLYLVFKDVHKSTSSLVDRHVATPEACRQRSLMECHISVHSIHRRKFNVVFFSGHGLKLFIECFFIFIWLLVVTAHMCLCESFNSVVPVGFNAVCGQLSLTLRWTGHWERQRTSGLRHGPLKVSYDGKVNSFLF